MSAMILVSRISALDLCLLTDEQKSKRMETSRDFISMCDLDPSSREVRSGYQFDPESKRQSNVSPTSRDQKRVICKIQGQNTVCPSSTTKASSIRIFFPESQSIHAAFYEAILNQLPQRIRRVWSELHRTGKWMLPHDNTPAHSVVRDAQILAQKMVAVLDHPAYSPDLTPMDFFHFFHA